jgi:hypothetical protein
MSDERGEGEDARLRAAFDALRRDDALRAPGFDEIRARPPRPARPSPLRVVAAAAPVVLLAAAVLLWIRQGQDAASTASAPAPAEAPALGGQAGERAPAGGGAGGRAPASRAVTARVDLAPLDFLLDTPGGSLLSSLPGSDAPRGSVLPSPPRAP